MLLLSQIPSFILGFWDYTIIFLFLFLTLVYSLLNIHKSKSLLSYFKAEGNLPWFISGTAMVATTFAADTPLAVTELVVSKGIWGNWSWWYMALGGVFTIFFFAPLWKRTGVMTDLEFLQIRYSGKGAKYLRAMKAIYLGGAMNTIILAWVNLAMLKILEPFFGKELSKILLISLFTFALLYTSLIGLGGISRLDVFQFFFAMGGCIYLAYQSLILPEVGGLKGLQEKLIQQSPSSLLFFPPQEEWGALAVLIFFLWWLSWYPGQEPGGGGYIAQRIIASRSEEDATKATLWFVIAHYFLRPWPWIIVALVSLLFFPHLPKEDQGKGYVFMIGIALEEGGKGFVLATFLAAYLSTVATHINWGASYIIHDFIQPYCIQNQSDSFYLKLTYLIQIITGILSLYICFYAIETISGTWFFLLEASSGIGFALVFRWFWWRIHAWSEFTGFLFSPIALVIVKYFTSLVFPYSALAVGLITIVAVLIVTFLFPIHDKESLIQFYRKLKPGGLGWRYFAIQNGLEIYPFNFSKRFIYSFIVFFIIIFGLAGIGYLLLGI